MGNNQTITVKKCGSAALNYYLGQSEPSTAEFISSYLKPGMTFFDIGALLGEYTLLAAKVVKPNGVVHSFEPNHEYYDLIKCNIDNNELSNVVTNCLAITDLVGEGTLLVPADPSCAHLQIGMEFQESKLVRSEAITTTTLDKYFQEIVGEVDLIKIDTEGAELKVLRGGRKLLDINSNNAPVWVIEYSPRNYARFGYGFDEIRALFDQLGYHIFGFLSNGRLQPIDNMVLGSDTRNFVVVKDLGKIERFLGGL